jgi:hypothetical protein
VFVSLGGSVYGCGVIVVIAEYLFYDDVFFGLIFVI